MTAISLPDGRTAVLVPGEEAGEFMLSVADSNIQKLQEAGVFSWRQATAAAELARLYGLGGGRSPWRRTGGGERAEEIVRTARAEYVELLSAAPRRTHVALTVLAMGEWVVSYDPRALWREGLDAIADRMRLGE